MYRKSPSKIWRKNKSSFRLVGSKSKSTGKEYFPPKSYESKNNNTDFEDFQFESSAKLVTWSVVRVGPRGFEKDSPYVVGILEFENGQRLTAQIVDVDFDKLEKGDVLYPTFRKIYSHSEDSVINYGLKWSK